MSYKKFIIYTVHTCYYEMSKMEIKSTLDMMMCDIFAMALRNMKPQITQL